MCLILERLSVILVRLGMHVDRVEGGKERGLLAESKTCPGPIVLFSFILGSKRRDQDGEVTNSECNTVFDGAWIEDKGIKGRTSESDGDLIHEIEGKLMLL